MISEDVLKECVETNEASVKDYLSRFFNIKEYDFSQFESTAFAQLRSMLVEDVEKIPGASFSRISWFNPDDPIQTPDALVAVNQVKVPKHLSNIKCYRLSLKYSVDEFIRERYIWDSKLDPRESDEREAALWIEERKLDVLTVFHFSSLLPFLHRQCSLIDKAMEEYGKFESLKELQRLVASIN